MADQPQSTTNSSNSQVQVTATNIVGQNKDEEPSFLDVKLPTSVYIAAEFGIAFGTDYVESLVEKAKNVIASSEKLSLIANMSYCIGRSIANPSMLLNSLSMVGNNILAATLQMAERIVNVAYGQITQALGQFTSLINNLLDSALNFINSMVKVLDTIRNLFDRVNIISAKKYEANMSDEDCEWLFASMASCMLNKLLGSKLRKLEEKITNKIVDTGEKLNSALADELADVNSMRAHIDRQTLMMKKAEAQIRGWDSIC